MAEGLKQSLEKLQLRLQAQDLGHGPVEDDELEVPRPRKKTCKTIEEVKQDIEQKFLTPPTSFSPEWLNRLQQQVLL